MENQLALDFDRLKASIDRCVSQHDYKKAKQTLEVAMMEHPNHVSLYALLGDVLQNVSKEEALAAYYHGLAIDPDNSYLHIAIGYVFFNRKEFERAERFFQKAWVDDPTNVRLLTVLGKIYKSQKKYEKAIKYYRICELVDPGNSFALYGLADAFRGIGNNEQALKCWLKFHGLEPTNKVAITRIGDCYMNLADIESALSYYQKALAVGYDFYAHLGIARAYFYQGRVDLAIETLERIAGRENTNSRYYYEYARICLDAGREESAKAIFKRAEKMLPGNTYLQSLKSKKNL